MSITSTELPEGADLISLDASTRSGLIAVGCNTGLVTLKGPVDGGGYRDLLSVVFGRGPCWVGIDEVEGVLWVAVVDGRVYCVDLHKAGACKEDFRVVGEHSAEIMHGCVNKEKGYFVTADAKGDIAVWNTKTHVEQPRRVLTPPEREKWHLVSTHGNHIIACRHNPDVYVFDLSGGSHEVRSLSMSVANTRQIRSLGCGEFSFAVGCTDGSLQKLHFTDRSAANAFNQVPKQELGRAVVHKDPTGARYPITSITLGPKDGWYISSGPLGLFSTKLKSATVSTTKQLVHSEVSATSATGRGLVAACGNQLVVVPWGEL